MNPLANLQSQYHSPSSTFRNSFKQSRNATMEQKRQDRYSSQLMAAVNGEATDLTDMHPDDMKEFVTKILPALDKQKRQQVKDASEQELRDSFNMTPAQWNQHKMELSATNPKLYRRFENMDVEQYRDFLTNKNLSVVDMINRKDEEEEADVKAEQQKTANAMATRKQDEIERKNKALESKPAKPAATTTLTKYLEKLKDPDLTPEERTSYEGAVKKLQPGPEKPVKPMSAPTGQEFNAAQDYIEGRYDIDDENQAKAMASHLASKTKEIEIDQQIPYLEAQDLAMKEIEEGGFVVPGEESILPFGIGDTGAQYSRTPELPTSSPSPSPTPLVSAVQSTDQYPPEVQAKIDKAIQNNPDMTPEQVIAELKRRGRI